MIAPNSPNFVSSAQAQQVDNDWGENVDDNRVYETDPNAVNDDPNAADPAFSNSDDVNGDNIGLSNDDEYSDDNTAGLPETKPGEIIAGPNTVIDPETGDPVTQSTEDTKISNRIAVFSGLDKITGNIITFDVYVNETVQFGVLQVTPRVCYSRPPSQTPKTTAFLEVDEQTLDRSIRRIFDGWMFADSPGLNAIEHPVYDIWLKDCKMDSAVPAPDGMAAATGADGQQLLGAEAIPEQVDPASVPVPEPRPQG